MVGRNGAAGGLPLDIIEPAGKHLLIVGISRREIEGPRIRATRP